MIKLTKSISTNFKKPKLFSTSYTRRLLEAEHGITQLAGSDNLDTNIDSTSSFRYEPPGFGIKSTQQLPIDWSNFANHTFFNNAEAKVNIAFDKIINEYPFDGSKKELEEYSDNLTGFEKYVLDLFPKNKGYLNFIEGVSSSISINDFAGTTHTSLSKNKTGDKILDPSTKSLTIEMQLFVTGAANSKQIICQNILSNSNGFYGYTIGLNSTASISSASAIFCVSSGTSVLSSSIDLQKNIFNHVTFTLNRKSGNNKIQIYKDSDLISTSSESVEIGNFGFTNQKFIIGSGTTHVFNNSLWTPQDTFIGAIDEFRVFHDIRTKTQIEKFSKKNIFSEDNLKLYFKFNEPTGSLGNLTSIVLDSSGNSLHSYITNFTGSMRNTGTFIENPMTYEKLDNNPVLFPVFDNVILLNESLLYSASIFDLNNPNQITKLIPQHFLIEGQQNEGFTNINGTFVNQMTGSDMPGTGQKGSAQLLTSLLYVWAKYFDELKMMISHMSNILSVDYDEEGTVADQFLPFLFKNMGFDAPNFFSNSSIEQFIDAENIGIDYDTSQLTLQQIQNKIWRRILINLNDIIRSKGTVHSVKSFLRSVGINPDTSLRIREFGGPTIRNLKESKQTKSDVSTLINMSGTLAPVSVSIDSQGIPTNKPFLQSQFLSSSRIEVGHPVIKGTMVASSQFPIHGISNNVSDGLHTSGSWTFEGIYKLGTLSTSSHFVTQSLVRFGTTGTLIAGQSIWANLLAMSGSGINSAEDSKIKLFVKTSHEPSTACLEMVLTGVNVFDGNIWNISFGRERNDRIDSLVSSSWFLRAGKQKMGDIDVLKSTSSFYQESTGTTDSAIQTVNSQWNASGSFFLIGSQSITASPTYFFLNNTALTGTEARYTNFSGKVGHLHFWSKFLTNDEWETHVKNFKSLGVLSPKSNFNFVTQMTGSFERLRIDASSDQLVTMSNSSGNISIFDFSQNSYHVSGTGFEINRQVIVPETFRYSFLSPKFDESATDSKIRVRSFQNDENIKNYSAVTAPLYQITQNEKPNDDSRFSIDFSIVDALDEDIINIFSTLESLDNVLGNPELLFSDDYPELDILRDVYFNRLINKINLRGFFEYFKWFDTSIGMFIEQLLPRKTAYQGTNFIIESHMLERPKFSYMSEDIYIDETLRRVSTINLITDLDFQLKD